MANVHGMNWIRQEKRLAIYLRDSFHCVYCGRDLHNARPGVLSLDHLKPRIRGGGNDASNLVTACCACNSSRQDRPWRRFAPAGAVERIERLIRRKLNVALAKDILSGKAPKCRSDLSR